MKSAALLVSTVVLLLGCVTHAEPQDLVELVRASREHGIHQLAPHDVVSTAIRGLPKPPQSGSFAALRHPFGLSNTAQAQAACQQLADSRPAQAACVPQCVTYYNLVIDDQNCLSLYTSFSSGATSASNQFYRNLCGNPCFAKLIRGMLPWVNCIASAGNTTGVARFLEASFKFMCTFNPVQMEYCPVLMNSNPCTRTGASAGCSSGLSGCSAIQDLGCCVERVYHYLNLTLPTFGRHYGTVLDVCNMTDVPGCVVPGVPRKVVRAGWVIRGLLYSVWANANRVQRIALRRRIAHDIARNIARRAAAISWVVANRVRILSVTAAASGGWSVEWELVGDSDTQTTTAEAYVEAAGADSANTFPDIAAEAKDGSATVQQDTSKSSSKVVTEGALSDSPAALHAPRGVMWALMLALSTYLLARW